MIGEMLISTRFFWKTRVAYFLGISDISKTVTNKSELIEDALTGYFFYIREQAAKELLKNAVRLLGEREELIELQEETDEAEKEYTVKTYEKEEQWDSLIEYVSLLPETY